MTGLSVHRVEVFGPKLAGVLRPLVRTKRDKQSVRGKGLSAVVIHTNQGVFYARGDDLANFNLGPSLRPDAHGQAYVHPHVLREAERVLAGILPKLKAPEARFHHYLGEEALGKRYFDEFFRPIDFAHLAFGLNASDAMFFEKISRGGKWASASMDLSIFPFQDIRISPAAQVLHYAQGVFEGLKAFVYADGRVVIFRLRDNALRTQRSAKRVGLTPVPVEHFIAAVRAAVLANRRLVPPAGLSAAMYVRPFHFGIGAQLGVAPAPQEAFMVFVSPVGPYFKGGFGGKRMLVETEYRRSAPGLMGDIKADANYAASVVPGLAAKVRGHIRVEGLGEGASEKWLALLENGYIDQAGVMSPFDDKRESLDLHGKVSRAVEDEIFELMKKSHFDEVIYLDAHEGKYIEEVGAANAFFVKDGVLYTPKLGTILPGITRDSIIKLARERGWQVVDDQLLPVELLLEADEVFCTGTAAVITPISSVTYKGQTKVYNNGEVGTVTRELYETLVGIQEGRIADTHDWIYFLE